MEEFKQFGIDPEVIVPEESLIYGLACTFSLVEKQIENSLKQYKLSIPKFNALMIIKHQGREAGISQAEISKKLIVTASNITKLLDRLEKDELICRFPDPDDRRVNIIKVTEKASLLTDEVWPVYLEKVQEVSTVFTAQEQVQLMQLLKKWYLSLN